jgi:cyclopropane fatty-acyl-phospholipid synthase-like methyltransferase
MKVYPRTEEYDRDWVTKNWMGPNPLWLLEELCEHIELRPGMKVLDMGCGKGITSVFLAKEFGVTVFANDLWISASDNLTRFEEAGVADQVFPIHAEAHTLPYAEGFFDVAISIDSYQYFGAAEMYFPCTYSKLVKPGGQFGIVVPGLTKEFATGYPETLKEYWEGEMFSFHSKDWWRHLWEKTGIVEIIECYEMAEPKAIWRPWAVWSKKNLGFNDVEFLDADTDDDLALIVMSAVKHQITPVE